MPLVMFIGPNTTGSGLSFQKDSFATGARHWQKWMASNAYFSNSTLARNLEEGASHLFEDARL